MSADSAPAERSSRWAPWWVYVAVAVGLNVIRLHLVPPEAVHPVVTLLLFAAVVSVSVVGVTAVHRRRRRVRG